MTSEVLRIEVLGPIRVVDAHGRDLTPTGSLQRRLLALLVLRRGQVVTPDSAIDALWPTALPEDPLGLTVRLLAFALVITAAALTPPPAPRGPEPAAGWS